VNGGGRFIVDWLHEKLIEYGHESEIVYLPFVDYPEHMLEQTLAYRLIDLSDRADRIICIRPPAYVLPHPNKVLWFIHHFRAFYDLWDTPYRGVPDDARSRALRSRLIGMDTLAFNEAQRVFTNSAVVADRLQRFNGVSASVLYPPLLKSDHFHNAGFNDEIVCVCRIEPHKRQHLLVDAMAHTRSDVKLRLCGSAQNDNYIAQMQSVIRQHGLQDRVILDNRWITEEEKTAWLAKALAVAYIPLDEDGYGYPTLEGAHCEKPAITTTDSGAVLEFVVDGVNGLVCEPEPAALAQAMDRLYLDQNATRRMGGGALDRIRELRIDWDTVVTAMVS
jgi:glycosyltransferase involved in cell wall biosynthesis